MDDIAALPPDEFGVPLAWPTVLGWNGSAWVPKTEGIEEFYQDRRAGFLELARWLEVECPPTVVYTLCGQASWVGLRGRLADWAERAAILSRSM